MSTLSPQQQAQFWQDGYLLVEHAVSADLLARLQRDFQQWTQDSRHHQTAYGKTLDGRARFDLDAGHSAAKPGLRRVNAPIEVSDAYKEAMQSSHMTDCVAALIGPNVKFHHAKINAKLPGSQTAVKWHQDFPFTPHSNDALVTALLMIDDVTADNGPLEVVPGSHRGEIHSLWHDGVFTGAITNDMALKCQEQARTCIGPAGSVCLMHTRLLHGSAPNKTNRPRTLFICVYSAEDAVPCSPNPVPTEYEGLLVRGERTGRIRTTPYEIELPQRPQTASFFDQQAQHQ